MDGIDIYTIPKIWARIVGYVPQSVFLIDDIVTTGATMNRAAELIHNMGARCVIAVSVFRTLPQTRR